MISRLTGFYSTENISFHGNWMDGVVAYRNGVSVDNAPGIPQRAPQNRQMMESTDYAREAWIEGWKEAERAESSDER